LAASHAMTRLVVMNSAIQTTSRGSSDKTPTGGTK
jgi:hypothetical protein